MKFNSSHVVIDADVARAAGLSEHPVSKSSRNVLQGILESGLHVAFCPSLLSEWREHRSLLAAKWLSSMIAKKRFHCITPDKKAHIEIEKAGLCAADEAVAQKDAHVIDIAVATGNFIASNDKIARGLFTLIATNSNLLDDLIWVIPTESSEKLVDVVMHGGYVPDEWRMCLI